MNIANIMAQLDELAGQVAFASDKAERALKASAAYGYQQSLGSIQTPIGGGLIIPATVTTEQLQDALITELKLADDAVTAAKLAVDAVTADAIAAGAITSTEIADDAITTPKLAAGSVITAKLGAAAVTANEIAANAVTTVKINAGAVTATTIAAGAVVAGKIDTAAVTSDTIAANAVTAGKLEATLVLASTIATASSSSRVSIDSTGIKAYNLTNQRVQILNDGSGWFGSSTAFAWTTAGAVTTTGITIKSASGNARVEIDSTGMKWYSSTGTQRGQILNDGSGWLGASSSFSWNTSGTVVMDGAFLTNATVTANKVSGGSLGGSFDMGTSSITVNSTGKINFGTGDYLSNDVLHFEVTGTDTAKVEFKAGAAAYVGLLSGRASSSSSDLNVYAYNTSSLRQAGLFSHAADTDAGTYMQVGAIGVSNGSIYQIDAAGTHTWFTDIGVTSMTLVATNRALSLYGRLYPGTGSATQATGYISWTDTTTDRLSVIVNANESYFDTAGRFVAAGNIFPGFQTNQYVGYSSGYLVLNGPIDIANSTAAGSTANWSTGLLAADTSYVAVKINGTVRRIPFYADA